MKGLKDKKYPTLYNYFLKTTDEVEKCDKEKFPWEKFESREEIQDGNIKGLSISEIESLGTSKWKHIEYLYELVTGDTFDFVKNVLISSEKEKKSFIDKIYEFEKMMNKAIKKVSQDIEEMKFNTCVSTFMTMMNEFTKLKKINKAEFKTFLILLNPFAPHITEELNEIAGFDKPISSCDWPKYDESKTIDDEIEIPVQVNGKLKTTITINLDEDEYVRLVEGHYRNCPYYRDGDCYKIARKQ